MAGDLESIRGKGCRTVTAFTLNKTEMQMHCYSTALALSS